MVKCNLTFAARSKGGIESARRKRARAVEKLAGLTSVQIFRMGFQIGWKQGVRTERRRTEAYLVALRRAGEAG